MYAIRSYYVRSAMRQAADTFGTRRADAFAPVADLEALRDKASEIRLQVLGRLPEYEEMFASRATKAGATVHRAKDAAAAREIIAKILMDHGATTVVKSKSMVSEEIHLNAHLEKAGVEVLRNNFV